MMNDSTDIKPNMWLVQWVHAVLKFQVIISSRLHFKHSNIELHFEQLSSAEG
jgi:hypothetical protein